MRAKTPEYRSSVAIIELVDGRVKVKLPKTVDGYAIGRRLAELLAGKNGVAFLHCTELKTWRRKSDQIKSCRFFRKKKG